MSVGKIDSADSDSWGIFNKLMKCKDKTLLEEAYGSIRKQSQAETAEQLLKQLVDTIALREKSEPEGYEYDSYDHEVNILWDKLESMGYTTKQLNQYCQKAGVS